MALKNRRTVNKNRCSLDIAREVLSIVSVKVRKTRIMYGANLSFVQLEKYLSLFWEAVFWNTMVILVI